MIMKFLVRGHIRINCVRDNKCDLRFCANQRKMTVTEQKQKLPEGKYTYVGVDVDATGRRILDEIVHLAAYSPTDEYDQYIIPVMNLNPAARQRHQLRVITVGFFRMLKCSMANRVVKSKTEIVALKSYLDWLEKRHSSDSESNGVILIYHEQIKFIPSMLLEAFQRYDLLERFKRTVVGFVNAHEVLETKCANELKPSTLRDLAKNFLDYKEEEGDMKNFEGNAMVRARLSYQIMKHLGKVGKDSGDDVDIPTDLIKSHVSMMDDELNELNDQKKCMDLQHTYRPIFVQYFKTNLYHRYKAVTFRRVLAENGFELKHLEDIWKEKKKEGLIEIISKLDEIKEDERVELIDILDRYFDPEKEVVVPMTKKSSRQRRRSYRSNRKSTDKRSGNEGESSGEQLTSSPENRGQRRRRPRRRVNTKRESMKQNPQETTQLPPTMQVPTANQVLLGAA